MCNSALQQLRQVEVVVYIPETKLDTKWGRGNPVVLLAVNYVNIVNFLGYRIVQLLAL